MLFRSTDLVDIEELDPGKKWNAAHIYEPTPLSIFNKMLRSVPDKPANLTFVDIGSGKGLVLLAAAQQGFRRIVGVEISKELCQIAKNNVKKFTEASSQVSPIEVICSDAANFTIPPERVLLYLHNPFGEPVIRQVASNIQQRLRGAGTKLYVLYYNPRFPKPLEEIPTALIRVASQRVWALAARNRCGFVLYEMGNRE